MIKTHFDAISERVGGVFERGTNKTRMIETQRCPKFSVSNPCSACSKIFTRDIYGDHAVSCAGAVDGYKSKNPQQLSDIRAAYSLILTYFSDLEKHVAKAIEEYEKGQELTKQLLCWFWIISKYWRTVDQMCKMFVISTFINGKLLHFSGTDGVARTDTLGLKRGSKCLRFVKCDEGMDKGMTEALQQSLHETGFLMCLLLGVTEKKILKSTFVDFPRESREIVTSSKPATLNDAIISCSPRLWVVLEASYAANLPGAIGERQSSARSLFPLGVVNVSRLVTGEGRGVSNLDSCSKDNLATDVTCFGCGNHGHYRSDCSELKN
ncbi:heparanase-like protein 3 [Tanacetum coccineum]